MASDDDLEPSFKKNAPQLFPRNVENESVAAMQTYLLELDAEKIRVQKEIDSRGGVRAAAEALFKA